MMQKYSHTKIYTLLLSIALLAACSSSDALTGGSTTDHPNGAIELSAGIVEGGSALVTRAGAEDNHGKHLTLTENTKLALRVSGTWTGHDPSPVVQTTTATVGSETATDSKHNSLSCSPVLYWDDYGTADPANEATGRTEGLTIFGAAINGKTTLPTALTNIADWTALIWTLNANQTLTDNTPADKDLLISNNVQAAPGASTSNDGTYKFDERGSGKLLEFRHALSKITVNLRANENEGFVGGVFAGIPEVKLTSNDASTSLTEWPLTNGTVNITTGAISSQNGNAVVTMFNSATTTEGWTKTYEALVMPGSEFTADNAIIARINADGNIYYVTAEKIRAAINSSTHATDGAYSTESGKNYVINVIVNKTDIDVTATVVDWTEVSAESVAPIINITVGYGVPGTAVRVNTFSFYRSLAFNDGYSNGAEYKINDYYKREAELTRNGDSWSMDPVRYWSNHNQHFQFRLVWPNTTTAKKREEDQNAVDPVWNEYFQKWRPHVEDKNYSGTNYQVIEIWNDPFQDIDTGKTDISNTEPIYHPYPSNLAIARPEFDNPETEFCTNNEPGHTRTNLYTGGICATEGAIDLKFRFVMSQVEVRLTTTTTTSAVRLEEAKVELVNAYTHGYVMLGDRTVKPDDVKTTDELDYWKKETNTYYYRSAIVPQELTYSTPQASTNLRFKITITNADSTTDVYYADVAPIKKSGSDDLVAPNGKWESGVHYVYNLNVSKTQIKATATLANWTTVEASEEVWF